MHLAEAFQRLWRRRPVVQGGPGWESFVWGLERGYCAGDLRILILKNKGIREGAVFTGNVSFIYDQGSSLGWLLSRFDAILINGIFYLLQFLQCIQVGRLPLFLQLFADVWVTRQAPGSLCDLGLNGKLPLQALDRKSVV